MGARQSYWREDVPCLGELSVLPLRCSQASRSTTRFLLWEHNVCYLLATRDFWPQWFPCAFSPIPLTPTSSKAEIIMLLLYNSAGPEVIAWESRDPRKWKDPIPLASALRAFKVFVLLCKLYHAVLKETLGKGRLLTREEDPFIFSGPDSALTTLFLLK